MIAGQQFNWPIDARLSLQPLAADSGYRRLHKVFGTVPQPVAHDVLDDRGSLAYVVGIDIERGESEAHDVGRAKIADKPPVDQRPHRGIALLETKRDLAAASAGVTRAGQFELGAAGFDELDEQVG